ASSLSPDSCFDMAGASGPLDFDSETGDADTDIAIWCLKKDTTGAIGFDPLLDSYYSIEENEVVRTNSDEVDGAHCLALDLANPHWCNPGDAPENEAGPDAGAAPSCPP